MIWREKVPSGIYQGIGGASMSVFLSAQIASTAAVGINLNTEITHNLSAS